MAPGITCEERRELLRKAEAYDREAGRTGRLYLAGFAQALRRFAQEQITPAAEPAARGLRHHRGVDPLLERRFERMAAPG